MKTIKSVIITAVLLISSSTASFAQQEQTSTNDKTRISLEIDPATFVFKGYGVHLRIQPKKTDHLFLGIGAYAMNMPDVLVDFNKNNKGKNWNVRLNKGFGVFAEHHFTEVNKKWFIGTQVSLQEYKIENDIIAGANKFTNLLAMGYFGYTLKPFDNNFYIKPWAGIGYSSKIDGTTMLGTSEYDNAPITMFATLHLGYTF